MHTSMHTAHLSFACNSRIAVNFDPSFRCGIPGLPHSLLRKDKMLPSCSSFADDRNPKYRSSMFTFLSREENSFSSVDASRIGKKTSSAAILRPDFRVALSVLAVFFLRPCPALKLFSFLIGVILVLQTARLRFRFLADRFDVLRVQGLSSKASEVVAIGPWMYRSIIDWDFWWPGFPVIAYFKEIGTKGTAQRHFFPILSDGKELYNQMMLNMGPSSSKKPPVEEWERLRPLDPDGYRIFKSKMICFVTEDAGKFAAFAARVVSNITVRFIKTVKQFLST